MAYRSYILARAQFLFVTWTTIRWLLRNLISNVYSDNIRAV